MMIVKFKSMAAAGVSRWAYRQALHSGKLKPLKCKIGNKYPMFWSEDVEKVFGLPAGALGRGR
jgi:hypothetical protein